MSTSRNKAWRFFMSVVLAIVLIIGCAPTMTAAAYTDQPAGTATPSVTLDSGSDILKADKTAPSQLDNYPDDVYGVDKGQSFMLSEQNELAFIAGDNGNTTMYRFDNLNLDMTENQDTSGTLAWVNGINVANAGSNSYMPDAKTEIYDTIECIQSVGLDAEGTGRKGYIASIGYWSSNLTLVIQNASTGTIKNYTVGTVEGAYAASYWMKDNYVAITAGDYDGDGKDSIVVYLGGDGEDNVKLIEYYPTETNGWGHRTILKLSSVVKNNTWKTDNHYRFKPVVGLATGDFNGDGTDQLAFSAGFYNTSGDIDDGYQDFECDNLEQFATCVGIYNYSGSAWESAADPIWMYDEASDYTQSGNYRTYALTIMHAGVITAGDVNNDGIDEIVAAGYKSITSDENSTNCARVVRNKDTGEVIKVSGVNNWSQHLVSSVISYKNKSYMRSSLTSFGMSRAQHYTYEKYCMEQDWAFVKLAMACGATNGNNSSEDVFISGIIYDFSNNSPEAKYTPNIVGSNDLSKTTGGGDDSSSVNWVRNVSVGNFNGNDAGREQFVFTLWQKYYGSDDNRYSSNVGVIAGVDFNDTKDASGTVTSYGQPKLYACNLNASHITEGNVPIHGDNKGATQVLYGANAGATINAVPVAVDIDDDGLMGRFNQSGYVYTDPEVLTVLEAGPYYGEINEAGGYEDPCGTSYSISYGYGTGTSRSDNVSFEAGFAGEVTVGSLKTSLELGYSMDWSHSYESSYTVTKTKTFVAQSQDIVVISRIPQLVYTYDIWDASKEEWITNGYNVKVPLSPRWYMLNIDGYNAFVDEYNAIVGADSEYALLKIKYGTDIPADHLGNPDKYWSDWSQAGEGALQLSNEDYSLSYGSGFISCEYETNAEKTESKETSHGFHYGLTIQGGAEYSGVGGFWAGGYVNLDYSHSTGHSTTTVDTNVSGGQVQNITASDVNGLTESEVVNQYGFTWNFGKWTRQLVTGGPQVPFYGYVVFGDNGEPVRRRALPVQFDDIIQTVTSGYASFADASKTGGLDSVLTVTKISGDDKIAYDAASKSITVSAGLEPGTYEAMFMMSNGLERSDGKAFSYDTKFKYVLTVIENYTENWTGSGTESDPYVITNTAGWDSLADMVAAGANADGVFFRLDKDINVSSVVGTDTVSFAGTFDGNGHTLTLDLNKTGDDDWGLAPFARIEDAEIRHLKTDGFVNGARHCSGLVGYAYGTNTIIDCEVSADITAIDYCGGILGHSRDSSTRIEGCVFSGSISGNGAKAGAIWGWGDSATAEVVNCVEDGSAYNNVALNPVGLGNPTNGDGVSNTYYATDLIGSPSRNWAKYGKKAYAVRLSEGVTIDLGDTVSYEVTGITAYGTGLKYGGIIRAGKGDEIHFRLGDQTESGMLLRSTAGTLNGNDSAYTLTMTEEDVILYLENGNVLAANHVIELIAAIPAVTDITDSDDVSYAVMDARASYEELTNEQKDLVGSDALTKLESSEKALEIRQEETRYKEAAEQADNEILGSFSELQQIIEEKSNMITNAVQDNNLGEVIQNLDELKTYEEQLRAASECYLVLSAEEKGQSALAADLIEAEQKFGAAVALGEEFLMSESEAESYRAENSREAQSAIDAIDEIPDLATIDWNDEAAIESAKTSIENARNAYAVLTPAQKALVTNAAKLAASEKSYGTLCTEKKIAALDPGSADPITPTDPVIKVVYNVTFRDGFGTTLKTETVEEGQAATAPEDPSKEGYTFKGWDKTFNNIIGDLTVTALWEQGEEPIPEVKVTKITISGISKKIAAGKKIRLTAKVLPADASNKKVVWKSSNTKIATVTQSGIVTIKKKTGGKSVTITATAADGSGVKATYKIKSMKGVVRKIAISGAKKTLKVGKTMKLKAKVSASTGANKTVKWTSSNTKYATVTSKGVVKALKAGKGKTVKITCMATDGSNKKKVVKIKIK